jgi:prepilin-type N-terminal cleavage/methylation domain-containing protein
MTCTVTIPISRRGCRAGVSLIEMLLALAISAMLLTATMVALDASFHAYAVASETAATQASTRLTTHRLLTLIRTSTAHGPLQADSSSTPPATLSGDTVVSPYIELIDPNDRYIRIEYRPAVQELWAITQPAGGGLPLAQPILRGVTSATFHCARRKDADGVWVLSRATMDLTVETTSDTTLELESSSLPPIRIIASTKPRKLD